MPAITRLRRRDFGCLPSILLLLLLLLLLLHHLQVTPVGILFHSIDGRLGRKDRGLVFGHPPILIGDGDTDFQLLTGRPLIGSFDR